MPQTKEELELFERYFWPISRKWVERHEQQYEQSKQNRLYKGSLNWGEMDIIITRVVLNATKSYAQKLREGLPVPPHEDYLVKRLHRSLKKEAKRGRTDFDHFDLTGDCDDDLDEINYLRDSRGCHNGYPFVVEEKVDDRWEQVSDWLTRNSLHAENKFLDLYRSEGLTISEAAKAVGWDLSESAIRRKYGRLIEKIRRAFGPDGLDPYTGDYELDSEVVPDYEGEEVEVSQRDESTELCCAI